MELVLARALESVTSVVAQEPTELACWIYALASVAECAKLGAVSLYAELAHLLLAFALESAASFG